MKCETSVAPAELDMQLGRDAQEQGADWCLLHGQAHCSLWWKQVPSLEGERLGVIGHFHSDNEADTSVVLNDAVEILQEHQCTKIVGPMDGNTWRSYRLLSWASDDADFLFDRITPLAWDAQWQSCGFKSMHNYISSVVDLTEQRDQRLDRVRERLEKSHIHIRNIDKENFIADLQAVYRLSVEAFAQNKLYTPLPESAFINQYAPYAEQIQDDFVLIAEDEEKHCCGFVFAVPDLAQMQRGEAVSRLIIKTLAVDKNRRSAGLGSLLVEEVQTRAQAIGLQQAVHALMYEGNHSANIGKHSRVIRRYTLYERNV